MIKNKKKGEMAKRYANSYASRDSGSGSKGGVINYRNHDGEIKFFSPAEGKHRINIIPYVIKTKKSKGEIIDSWCLVSLEKTFSE